MTNLFAAKLLSQLKAKKAEGGFTLIELLVVVIIIGILSSIALPQFLNQAARARQSEAESTLGAINRAQQVHRLSNPAFGTLTELQTSGTLSLDVQGGNVTTEFYVYQPGTVAAGLGPNFGHIRAVATADYQTDVSNYAAGVSQDTQNGVFASLLCRAIDSSPTNDPVVVTPPAVDTDGSVTTAMVCDGLSNAVN